MVKKQLAIFQGLLSITYLVLDGHFGNNNALQMVRQCGLHLISKLRHDAALHFVYQGAYAGKGPPKKYADKINYAKLPDEYLVATREDKQIKTCIYQAHMLYHEFAQRHHPQDPYQNRHLCECHLVLQRPGAIL
jgi:putative transposase